VSGRQAPAPGVYRRHRPETTALYEVVRDNLETLYGAIDDGAIAVRIPKHARKELEAYLDCGLLCRGFARLRCQGCGESRWWRSVAGAGVSVASTSIQVQTAMVQAVAAYSVQ
jgi:hypothetical protein